MDTEQVFKKNFSGDISAVLLYWRGPGGPQSGDADVRDT